MSDNYIGKKEGERVELELFLEAYECVTGEVLSVEECAETPDFICERPNGNEIGLELTKLTRDPRDIFWERALKRKEQMDPYEAQEYIYQLIEKKEKLRATHYSIRVKDTILVLQLFDGAINAIKFTLEEVKTDFIYHGFSEIWLADYSGLEAYGDIELFGLFPDRWWGHHQRPWPERKPYG
jgi:hypothetical protein